MKKIYQVMLIGCMLFTMSAVLPAQPLAKGARAVAKQTLRVPSVQKSGSILDELDRLYAVGELAKRQHQVQKKLELLAARQRLFAEWDSQREASPRMQVLRSVIIPTAPQALPALGHPFTGQEFVFSRRYQAVMEEFVQIRKNFSVRILFAEAPVSFVSEQKRELGTAFQEVLLKMEGLQKIYPQDKPLQQAIEYIHFAMGEINPMWKGTFEKPLPRPMRRFQAEEFVFDEMWFEQIARMAWPAPTNTLPEKLNVIVVNDDPTVPQQYLRWKMQGLFPAWNFAFLDNAEEAVKKILKNDSYQLLITDWTVANSSVTESVRQLRANGSAIPVIVCSSYTVEQINAKQMFNQGFDGFVSWGDVTARGPDHLLESLKKYFFYKEYYKW